MSLTRLEETADRGEEGVGDPRLEDKGFLVVSACLFVQAEDRSRLGTAAKAGLGRGPFQRHVLEYLTGKRQGTSERGLGFRMFL